jgi:hypothetical protein
LQGIALFEVQIAALIDGAEWLNAVFQAGVEVIEAMVGGGMNAAGALSSVTKLLTMTVESRL